MPVNCTPIIALSLASLLLLPVIFPTQIHAQLDEEWKTTYAVGKFLYNEPPKSDQIFKIYYRVVNGTVDEFLASQYGAAAQVNSSGNATLEIKFPRNFPYTNGDGSPDPIFFINELEVFPSEKRITDCLFIYSIPYAGASKIELVLTYLATNLPFRGDDIPDSCISETIADASTMTPIDQLRAGIAAADVVCKEGLERVIDPNGKPYCATPASADILKERWK